MESPLFSIFYLTSYELLYHEPNYFSPSLVNTLLQSLSSLAFIIAIASYLKDPGGPYPPQAILNTIAELFDRFKMQFC